MPSPYLSMVNGKLSAHVSVHNRGLAYGDGLFETIKVIQSVPLFFDYHLSRLAKGCHRLDINFDKNKLRKDIIKLVHSSSQSMKKNAVLKVMVVRGESGRGYKPSGTIKPDYILSITENMSSSTEQKTTGIKLRICDQRLSNNPHLAGLKHLNRLDNVIARGEWRDESIHEGLMLDEQGRVVEGTMSNFFLIKEGIIYTPSLMKAGVEGIVRQIIIERLAVDINRAVIVKDVTVSDVVASEEAFICNSLIGIVPVVAVGCHLKAIGLITRSLQDSLALFETSQMAVT